MKKRKILPVILAATLMMSTLSGCSSITVGPDLVGKGTVYKDVSGLTKMEEKKADAVKNAFTKKFSKAEINTMEANMKIVADLSVSDSGISMGIKADLDDTLQIDMENEIMNQQVEGEMEVLGMSIDLFIDSYTLKEGKKFVNYMKVDAMDEEGEWEKSESENSLSNFSFIDEIDTNAIKAIYQDAENGAYVFEIDPEALEGMTESVEDSLGDVADYSFNFSKVRAYMTLDKQLGIVGYYVDLSGGMDISSEESLSIDQFDIEFTYLSLNEELDISLPRAAKKAKEETVETENPFHPIEETEPVIEPETEAIQKPEPETEAEETLPTKEDIDPTGGDVQIDISIYGYTDISINGKTISLPCSISTLEAAGLTLESSEMIDGGSFGVLLMGTGKDDRVIITVDNPTSELLSTDSCLVTTINYDSFLADSVIDFAAFGVRCGMNKSEAEAILGTPVYTYTGDNGYMSNDYIHEKCEITITYNDGIVTGIEVSV